jgi:hypothetical protein
MQDFTPTSYIFFLGNAEFRISDLQFLADTLSLDERNVTYNKCLRNLYVKILSDKPLLTTWQHRSDEREVLGDEN